nr:MAG TPA: hypothetical protein [Caudoviricetes sp.]DAU25511.1 MAG TPA: hypothetical protein [Caudoviricetes sp.]DAX25759.1 MAG TPA: hypothetical protein [Caudoviricetes sp.]
MTTLQYDNLKKYPSNLFPSFSYLTFCETHSIL